MKKYLVLAMSCIIGLCIGSLSTNAQVKETRNVEGFTKINVSGGIDLFIEQGEATHVVAEAKTQELLDQIVTEVEGNTLKIYNRNKIWSCGMRNVHVTLKTIESIHASGGSDATSQGGIKSSELEIGASGGSDINMIINAEELRCNISGGSDASLKGEAHKFKAVASGGSDLKAKEFIVDICDLTASGGSDAYITVNEELSANANGGSDITYYGEAKIRNISSNGGSDVNKR